MWAALILLGAIETEISFILSDVEEVVHARSERAFSHLQRSIVADASFGEKWRTAFNEGEISCEKLGAAHLLLHGIWAFKINAEGARTDLIFQVPAEDLTDEQGFVDGFVLTEWKKATSDADAASKCEQARNQAQIYAEGALAGSELTGYRYVVVVSLRQVRLPVDVRVDGVVYRHINISVEPRIWRHEMFDEDRADEPAKYEDSEHQGISEEIAAVLGPDVERRVKAAVGTWNQRIRASLRDATGLRLSHNGRTQDVPIRVVPDLPYPFIEILRPWRNKLQHWQSLDLTSLATTSATLTKLIEFFDPISYALQNTAPPEEPAATPDQIAATKAFVDQVIKLKKIDWEPLWPKPEVPEVPEAPEAPPPPWNPWEPFGSYSLRPPRVQIHWTAIGVFVPMCADFHFSIEQLTAAVLAHELAHAYTHIGFDTDGNQWDSEDMLATDIHVVEGLAQFYTKVFCDRQHVRDPELLDAFNELLEIQRGNGLTWYTCFEEWAKKHGHRNEIVRVAMIETRALDRRTYPDFLKLLSEYENKWPQPGDEGLSHELICF